MDNQSVLVLGAGATLGGAFQLQISGTRFEPPLDKNFFESPAVQHLVSPDRSDRYPALDYYRQDPGLEATWAKVDLLLKLCLSRIISEEQTWGRLQGQMMQRERGQNDESYRQKLERECCHFRVPSMAEWELRSLIREVYSTLGAPDPAQDSPLYTLVNALLREGTLRGIVTFNYDTSLETLFLEQFYYPSLQTGQNNSKLPLMKLHGSLNWQESRQGQDGQIICVNHIANMNYRAPGDWIQPAVIGPTFFKQEITIDSQQDYRARFYKKLWQFAWDILRNARNLIFVGFSFPQTDFHARALFQTAHVNGAGFRRVLLCHRGDQALRTTVEHVFNGRLTRFTEFPNGLENMAERVDEVIALLH